MQQASIR